MNWVHLSFASSTSGVSFALSLLWVDLMDFVIHSLINLIKIIVIGSTWSRECYVMNRMTLSLFILRVQSNREIVTGMSLSTFLCKCWWFSFSCNSVFSFWLCSLCDSERTLDSCLFNTRFPAKLVTSFSHSISILFAFKVKTRLDTSKERKKGTSEKCNDDENRMAFSSDSISWFNHFFSFVSLTEKVDTQLRHHLSRKTSSLSFVGVFKNTYYRSRNKIIYMKQEHVKQLLFTLNFCDWRCDRQTVRGCRESCYFTHVW